MKTLEEYKMLYATTEVMLPESPAEELLYALLEEYANDKNSSKFREDITKLLVGLRPSNKKKGYDDDVLPIEVKPANYTGGKERLNGKGTFSDFTWQRHKKYMADDVRMLSSGFCAGKILYVVEFPYRALSHHITAGLKRALPNGDMVSRYARCLTFNYRHWSTTPYHIRYLRPNIREYKDVINKYFFKLLTSDPLTIDERHDIFQR